ncbi:hypothetical protein CERSUDRAFT_115664 [Gelatoporia subvermispora B]|uniref:Fungal STAND N-terminal Goodbye domain-containing protein n=1 Tax=Ceriporiopsis subvermispora (strain B) TaxID=914234 RepID=M2QHW4_CERS8|nr:hypothetical protein CERSUDRAFT_115664 [Gelatoporia subvermispora B]
MSQLEVMFLVALEKCKRRTKMDLSKEPFFAKLEHCKTADDVMMVPEERINKLIERQEKGKAKGGLAWLLSRIVDVLLALRLGDTVGEATGLVGGAGKAVIGAIVVLLETIRDVGKSCKMLMDLLEDVSNFVMRLEVYSNHTLSPVTSQIIVNILV